MSERKLLELVESTGIVLAAGTLSTLLTESRAAFTDEARAVLRAGLASTPYQHLDDTSTRVNGDGWYCHILCNALDTAYQTTPRKDRRTIGEILRGGRPAGYRDDREAERHLAVLGLSTAAQARVRAALPRDQEAGSAAWDTFMTLAATTRKLGLDLAAYLTDRFTRAGQIPPLADLIAARAAQLALSPTGATT